MEFICLVIMLLAIVAHVHYLFSLPLEHTPLIVITFCITSTILSPIVILFLFTQYIF